MTTTLAAKIANDYGTPALVIDMDRVERNIARIQKVCDDAGVANRPHIKTHKSPVIAKMQIAAGWQRRHRRKPSGCARCCVRRGPCR